MMPPPAFTTPTYLVVTALDDGSYRVRLGSVFGPLQPAGDLSFSQLVDTLRAWRGLVKTTSPVVGRLVELTGCSLVAPSGPVPREPLVYAA